MEDYDPLAEQARLAAEREAFVAETMASLAPGQRALLQRVLEAVTDVVSLQEDHNFYLDQRLGLLPRRLILAAGRRLAARGRLADPTDVFYLRWTELVAALRATAPPDGLAALAQARCEGFARWATVTPPPFIGTEPPPPPSAAPGVQAATGPGTLDGEATTVLRGNGGSAGVARGPARVLRHLGEADKLRPGDVLVARTTMPAWTPLFAVASALVVEVGGVLSHAAVTAREYGLPAVLSVQGATSRIRDGQLVEVDGTRGRVRLLS
jgi:pyruvate,water dikinase